MSRRCKYLVLDSGPLLSLSPLRGLAETYLTVPQVLDELKDKHAREHFQQLGLSAGVQVIIQNPDATSFAQVVQFSKKTGDYAVLSHADICVLALAHTLHEQEKALTEKKKGEVPHTGGAEPNIESCSSPPPPPSPAQPSDALPHDKDHGRVPPPGVSDLLPDVSSTKSGPDAEDQDEGGGHVPSEGQQTVETEVGDAVPPLSDSDQTAGESESPEDEPSSLEDDGEGEWITPDNVALHKARALQLLPVDDKGKKGGRMVGADQPVVVGCMTADFAMQNVLLQMGLSLVNTDGNRIQKVKNWVLRCHACFKICKDNSKQFCPSCGNPTLIRASVTVAAPDAAPGTPSMKVHLKKNFQYKLRGTKYSIPAPKPGSAKTGTGEGLILREDQIEYLRAKKRVEGKKEREERRMIKGLVESGGKGGVAVGSWSDPDWVPPILASRASRSQSSWSAELNGIPQIGYGRKNPNERKKKK